MVLRLVSPCRRPSHPRPRPRAHLLHLASLFITLLVSFTSSFLLYSSSAPHLSVGCHSPVVADGDDLIRTFKDPNNEWFLAIFKGSTTCTCTVTGLPWQDSYVMTWRRVFSACLSSSNMTGVKTQDKTPCHLVDVSGFFLTLTFFRRVTLQD